jgi:hypothetical protein
MSTKRRVVLHLGASKCGTTSFQAFLLHHDDQLRAKGILRPRSTLGRINDLGLGAYVGIQEKLGAYMSAHNLSRDDLGTFETDFERRLLEEVAESDPETVIFSFEGLLRFKQAQVEKLMGLIYKISTEVHAITVLRRHDRWAVSSYNTRLVSHGTASRDQLSNDAGHPHGIRFAQQLALWESYVPRERFTVFAYEDHHDVLLPYMDAIDFCPAVVGTGRHNIGISAYGQEVLRKYNEIRQRDGIPSENQIHMRRCLKAILPKGKPILPSAADVERHKKVFATDRDQLTGNYLRADSQFFDDLTVYPEKRTEIDVSEAEVADWVEKAAQVHPETLA